MTGRKCIPSIPQKCMELCVKYEKKDCIGFDNYNFVPTGGVSNTHTASDSGTRRSPYVFVRVVKDELPKDNRPSDGK